MLRGLRGTGKTTALRLAARWLIELGDSPESIVYMDLEDSALFPRPTLETLDSLIRAAGIEEGGKKKYLFLDEVGRIDGWVDWAKTIATRHRVSIAASESGSPGFQGVPWDVTRIPFFTLSFGDVASLSTDKKVDIDNPIDSLEKYLRTGGLPMVYDSDREQESLRDLFLSVIFRDIILRTEIRDPDILTAMAVNLVSNPGGAVSATSLKGKVTRSIDQARSFLSALEASGLLCLAERYEDKGRPAQASRRIFPADTGLSVAVGQKKIESTDLAEVSVYQAIVRLGFVVRTWRVKNTFGLLVDGPSGGSPVAIHVNFGNERTEDTKYLETAMKIIGTRHGLYLGDNEVHEEKSVLQGTIKVMPLWSWLLMPELSGISTDKKVDIVMPVPRKAAKKEKEHKEEPEPPKKMPSHLL